MSRPVRVTRHFAELRRLFGKEKSTDIVLDAILEGRVRLKERCALHALIMQESVCNCGGVNLNYEKAEGLLKELRQKNLEVEKLKQEIENLQESLTSESMIIIIINALTVWDSSPILLIKTNY